MSSEIKILYIDLFGNHKILTKNHVPNINDQVNLFYKPIPSVKSRIWYPDLDGLKNLGITEEIDVIITLS